MRLLLAHNKAYPMAMFDSILFVSISSLRSSRLASIQVINVTHITFSQHSFPFQISSSLSQIITTPPIIGHFPQRSSPKHVPTYTVVSSMWEVR